MEKVKKRVTESEMDKKGKKEAASVEFSEVQA